MTSLILIGHLGLAALLFYPAAVLVGDLVRARARPPATHER